jgi:thymidylate synthase
MSIETFSAATLDDLLHELYNALLARGTAVRASRGDTLELAAGALELTNPLARLSRSEARGIVFTCLGELCWYLAGDDSLETIRYYLPAYVKEAVGGKVLGAYGPRLFGSPPGDQVENLLRLLRARPQSRRAVLQLFDAKDLRRAVGDVPCTCTLQFLVREDALDVIAYMRSNDAVKGLTHDVFCFTMLQELVARTLNLRLGRYCHMVGSLHLYTGDRAQVERFLREGFQSTKSPMPPMPEGDPWPAVRGNFLPIEAAIRAAEPIPPDRWDALPTYWRELGRLLEAFSARRAGQLDRVAELQAELADTVYSPFLTALAGNSRGGGEPRERRRPAAPGDDARGSS